MRILAVTGHRPETMGVQFYLPPFLKYLKDWMQKNEATYVVGGARGADTWVGQVAVELGFPIRIYLPFPEAAFTKCWGLEDRVALAKLMEKAEIVKAFYDEYNPDGYLMRDQAMVDTGQELLAIWDGRGRGGTWNTVRYARVCGKPIHQLHPIHLEMSYEPAGEPLIEPRSS